MDVVVDPMLASKLRPHQVESVELLRMSFEQHRVLISVHRSGIKFLYEVHFASRLSCLQRLTGLR